MANNKVQLADGTTLIDLTSDTVTPQTMLAGTTAHAASGEQITGVVNLANAGTNTPLVDSGEGSVGTATAYAREDHVHPTNTKIEKLLAPVLSSFVAPFALYIGDYVIINEVIYRITENISAGGSIVVNTNATAIGGENYSGALTYLTRKNATRSTQKVFPTKASDIANNNNLYKVGYDGTFYLTYTFANSTYSQFGIQINGQSIGPNISSASHNLYGLTQTIALPVIKGDVIRVTFYNAYEMFSITGYLIH